MQQEKLIQAFIQAYLLKMSNNIVEEREGM